MKSNQNFEETWDIIWERSSKNEINVSGLEKQIIQTKESKLWKYYTEIITSRFGGWNNVVSIELGAGMGWHSMVAASEGAIVYLLDYSGEAIDLAKKRFHMLNIDANFIQGNAFDTVINKVDTFNLSWSFGTAEHFSGDLRQAFFNLHFDYIVKGGIAIISCPYKYALNYRIWMYYAKKYEKWQFGLEIPYSKSEFLKKIKSSHNKLIKVVFDEGNPCLRKAISILKEKSILRYIFIGGLLKVFQKLKFKVYPFFMRSIILIGEKK